MPEEAQQAPETESQDTPAPDAASPVEETPAESTDSTPAVDWEQRYNSLRPEYDRSNQLLAAARGEHGPEAQIDALRQLGVEAQMDEEQEPEDDEWQDPDERIDRLEGLLAEQREAEEIAHFQQLEDEYIDSTLSEIEKEANVKLSEREERIVINAGLANRLSDGRPDLQGAFDDLKGIKDDAGEAYLKSKKEAPKAPIGTAGEQQIDPRNKDARNKIMAEEIAARAAAAE